MINLTIDLDNQKIDVVNINDNDFNVINIYRKIEDISQLNKFGYKVDLFQMPNAEKVLYDYTESDVSKFKDNPFLIGHIRFYEAAAGSSVLFNITAYNKRKSFSHSFEIKVPIPDQPYKSWTWDKDSLMWIPPVPMPEPLWSEEKQSWYLP